MLWVLIVLLVVGWFLSIASQFAPSVGWLLLVIAAIVLGYQMLSGRRAV